MIIRLLAFTLVATFALIGCGSESITSPGLTDTALVEDPLDGVLNSTEARTPADPGERIARLAAALDLTEEQVAALTDAYGVFRAGIDDLKAQVDAGDLTRDEAKALAADLREAFEAELQVILTPEQYDLLQEMRQNKDGGRRGHRDRSDRWNAWMEEIGADEAQLEAINAAAGIFHDGMKALHEQVKDGTLTRGEVKDEAKALRDAFDAALQEILTEEQYAMLLELRPDCGGRDHGSDNGHGGPQGR